MTKTITTSRAAEIKSQALSVLEMNRIWKPPVSAINLAKANGFRVTSAVFGPKHAKCVAGFIDVANSKIVVNAEDTHAERNFTVAHELGHYLLGHHSEEEFEKNYSVLMRGFHDQEDPMEIEANVFADNLLVPVMFLREYIDNYPRATDQELSRIFGVPSEVIRYRRPFVK